MTAYLLSETGSPVVHAGPELITHSVVEGDPECPVLRSASPVLGAQEHAITLGLHGAGNGLWELK